MVRIELGYPEPWEEADMLEGHAAGDLVAELEPVADLDDVRDAQAAVAAVHGSADLRRYVVALAEATRRDPRLELGASPRAALMLFRAAKALAALEGRGHVLPDDVQALAGSVLSHRLLLAPGVPESDREAIVADAVETVPAL
jgi:MoxR-like ATPase